MRRGWRWGDDPAVPTAVVRRGGVLAIPTESSYGLAADPRNRRGVEAIYAIKGRERGKPLPVVAASREQLGDLGVDLEHPLTTWAAARWPAPLSVAVPAAAGLPAAAGAATVAVRVPGHDALRRLLAATGPLTATSANAAGRPPILDPEELDALLAGHDALVVEGGVLPGGPPSTLVAWRDGALEVLRRGAFPLE